MISLIENSVCVDCLANFSKQTTCQYALHIVEFKEVPWFPSGTRVMPCHSYKCCSKIGCIMEDNMKNITKLPRFMPGQVIDISYKNSGLPNRLLIKSVSVKEQDSEWMYECFIESIGTVASINESFIVSNATNKNLQVYKCAEVIKLYNDGWRFCGNFNEADAHKIASKNAINRYIKHIILRPALNTDGCLKNGYYGIWVKYNNTINCDGTIVDNNSGGSRDTIVIK